MNTPQIVTKEFATWLETTSFAGHVDAGDQWDTEVAWPSRETMTAARECFAAFETGDLKRAEELMWDAQRPYV